MAIRTYLRRNLHVAVAHTSEQISSRFLQQRKIKSVIVTDAELLSEYLVDLNARLRENNVHMLSAHLQGLFAVIFADYGECPPLAFSSSASSCSSTSSS